jgi:hypothetical protein
MIFDPFRLFGRLILAVFQIAGYSLVFIAQILWFLLHGRSDKIGDALGWYGKGLVDTTTAVFRR